MAWLTGYKYRKQITIAGSTAGEQTDYQKKLVVHKASGAPHITSFTFLERLSNKYAKQGIASDGTYLYVTDNNAGEIYKLNKDGDVIASNLDGLSGGTAMDQINGVHVRGDYLYIGAHISDPLTGYIRVYNKSDLAYVEEHQVTDHDTEGCAYHDGYWWVVYSTWAYISKYNDSWEHQTDYAIPYANTSPGNIVWHGDYVYYVNHEGAPNQSCDCIKWTGSEFTAVARLKQPSTYCTQGIGIEPGEDIMWWAERVGATYNIVKSTINYDEIYLNTHCRDDFNDIRFTKSDGSTELDHCRLSYVAGDYAIFGVEFDSIGTGVNTFYIYYDKSDADSGSSGGATFPQYDISDIKGFWRLDEDSWDGSPGEVKDETGVNDGTAQGNANTIAGGKFGRAGTFAAVGDYVDCGNDVSVRLYNNLTILAWVKWTGVLADKYIAGNIGPGSESGTYLIKTKSITGKEASFFCRGDTDWKTVDGSTDIQDGEWHLVAGVVVDNVMHLYVDGAEEGTPQTVSNMSASDHKFEINAAAVFVGDIDEVIIVNAVLSEAVIQSIFDHRFDKWGDKYIVRKYCSPEPTWGAWGDEEYPPPAASSMAAKLIGVGLL